MEIVQNWNGSWGLPDLGITEAIGSALGAGKTAQGGSNITNAVGTFPTAITNGGQQIQGPGLGWYGDTTKNPSGTAAMGAVQTTQTSGSGSGGGGGGSYYTPPSVDQQRINANAQQYGGSRAGIYQKYGYDPTRDDINDPRFAAMRNEIQAGEAAYNQAMTAQVDEAYNPVFNEIGAMEQNVRNQEQDMYTSATKPYDAQLPMLQNAYQSAQQTNAQQKGDVYQQQETALAQARRLYNELQQGVQQRFGGTSSAGEMTQAFNGREQQRQTGQIGQTTAQNIQKLVEQSTKQKAEFDAQLQSLEQQIQAALADAKNKFQDRLMQINSLRATTQQNKAERKLGVLSELRAYQQQIQNYFMQQQGALEASAQQADLNLRNAILSYRESNGNPVNLNAYGVAAPAMINGGTAYNPNAISGNIGRKTDEYGRIIA